MNRKQEAAPMEQQENIDEQFCPKELQKLVFSNCQRLYHKAIVNFEQILRYSHKLWSKVLLNSQRILFYEGLLSQNPKITLGFTVSTPKQLLILMIWRTPVLPTKTGLVIRKNNLDKAAPLFEFVSLQFEYWFLLFFLNVWGRYTTHLDKRWEMANIYSSV